MGGGPLGSIACDGETQARGVPHRCHVWLSARERISGLERTVRLDRAIRATAERLGEDTLILFTADHSYDLRVHDGRRGKPLLPELDQDFGADQDSIRLDNVRRDDDHTGEEVIVAARGPGSSNVKGVMSNIDLFGIMRDAFGWR